MINKLLTDPVRQKLMSSEEGQFQILLNPFRCYLNDIYSQLPKSVHIDGKTLFHVSDDGWSYNRHADFKKDMLKNTINKIVSNMGICLSREEYQSLLKFYSISDNCRKDAILQLSIVDNCRKDAVLQDGITIEKTTTIPITREAAIKLAQTDLYRPSRIRRARALLRNIISVLTEDNERDMAINKYRTLSSFIYDKLASQQWNVQSYRLMRQIYRSAAAAISGHDDSLFDLLRINLMSKNGEPIYALNTRQNI